MALQLKSMSDGTSGGVLRKLLLSVVVVVLAVAVLRGVVGTIATGNVGVRTTLGITSQDEVSPGVYLKWPFISRVDEFTAKEVAIDLTDLTPKARDNLSLRDMDISVYYRAEGATIAELFAKYAGQSARADEGYMVPAYNLVRAVITDPSIEESIRNAVANQKRLEAMAVQTQIAQKEAEIKVTEARGIAESNRIIAGCLTREYLQHEANQVLLKFAESDNASTVILPSSMNAAPLIAVNPPAPVTPK
jgi:hypothetical protein